jgi:hypothetical protein
MKAAPYQDQDVDLSGSSESVRAYEKMGVANVYAIFICWTLFSVFLYSRFSQLGDAHAYLTGAYSDDVEARTLLIASVATRLIALLHSELLSHFVFSLFAASGVAYLVNEAGVHGRYRWPLLAVLFLPSFGVWASVLGRESLFVGLLGYFMGAVAGHYRSGGGRRILLALVCVSGMVFIRAPFGAGVAMFFLVYLCYRLGPRTGLSVGVQFVVLAVLAAIALLFAWPYIDGYIAGEVLPKARSYFALGSETTRLWVNISTTRQLFTSLWWTLPLALVGPTPAEVAARPVMLPFFVSGVTVCGILLYSIGVALRSPAGALRKILVLGWLPAMVVMLIAYVPFGIYNAGSGIRYASCLILFLILPSMLLSAMSAESLDKPAARPLRRGQEWRVLVN